MTAFTESEIEAFALDEFQRLGFAYVPGPALAPVEAGAGEAFGQGELEGYVATASRRQGFEQVVLDGALRAALEQLNPSLPSTALDQAMKAVVSVYSPQLVAANEAFHDMLVHGVPVTVTKGGQARGERVWLVDFAQPQNNHFTAVNQLTITHRNQPKRPDIVLYVNGLPLVVVELKNPADAKATLRKAYDQLQTYKATIPALFYYNALCVVSDGLEARAGTLSAPFSRFQAWKTVDGQRPASSMAGQLSVLIEGMLNQATLLDLLRNFIVFEKDRKTDPVTGLTQVETVKKLAGYHQYYAVNKAVDRTRLATAEQGSRKAGVVWHTQGSGKSLSMVFYAAKLAGALDNPTLVVLTDRNDLDQQLFDTFAACAGLLGQAPVQAESREDLKAKLKVASGGIVFTTMQKFLPPDTQEHYDLLSQRRNIVVMADEAHRSQYGFEAKFIDVKDKAGKLVGKRVAYGFAKYLRDALPNASFIGFTGTPVENEDINTKAVFGDYIDIYDIAQAVEDGATVKIYYESRLAKVNLTAEGRHLVEELDREMEEDGADEAAQAKARWAKLEAIVGHPARLKNLARDIVEHFERRRSAFDGKAMVVTMSRRIAVDLYEQIRVLRPEWHSDDPKAGEMKVVMTSSSSDKLAFDAEDPDSLVVPACHRTNREQRQALAERMKDPADSLKLVIVRDMWLTGFDAPSLSTLYIDRLLQRHTLMQAIARVNRVYRDKQGGLVVDYIGIGPALKKALDFYAKSGGKGQPTETQALAVKMLVEKAEVVRQILPDFDVARFFKAGVQQRLSLILEAEERILALPDGKTRFLNESTALGKLFALAVPHEKALALADEVAFWQAVRARFMKFDEDGEGGERPYESAIRQIVSQAVESTQVVDIFDAAGIKKPEISLLSEEFLGEVRSMKHKHLAMELLKRLLNNEVQARLKFNLTQGRKLLDLLEQAIHKYQNNLLTTAEIIEEMIQIAREIRGLDTAAGKLHLSQDEYAFYSALELNDSAVKVLGDETLQAIAREIADKVRTNATLDWTLKESARAKLMVLVKRTLNRHGYPPDKQQKAVDTVMKQAEVMADHWVEA